MKKPSITSALTVTALLAVGGVALAQQAGTVQTLRGSSVDDRTVVEDVFHLNEKRLPRNYRQQPPLIPHGIAKYQVDLRANECLACHDWTNAGERNAPTLSMTHYMDRDGNQLDSVAGTRWFCNQCHVPQADAPALVDNDFTPSN